MSLSPDSHADTVTSEESQVKALELQVRRLEAEKALAGTTYPWWRRADPLVLAILAGVLTLLGNMAIAVINNYNGVMQEKHKADDDLALEQAKARYNLVLQAMATNDASVAKRNIHFFIDAGLLDDRNCKIRDAIDRDKPVLPSLSGMSPPMPEGVHSAPEIARLYNFPPGLDGRGQTIGILEFGGSLVSEDLASYFKTLSLPVPDVTTIGVDGARDQPVAQTKTVYDPGNMQVMLDVEIAGAIAPRARIRVYFAPFDEKCFADAVKRAAADHVSVLSIGWGQPESEWQDDKMKEINTALEAATKQGITVLAASGAQGVTDGVADKRRHVDFPASSPWVLSVGGTSLKAKNGRIESETVWRDDQYATGGGFSEKFPRPDWQSGVPVPGDDEGVRGRGIPDVVASADPAVGVGIIVGGHLQQIGGTGASLPLWAGLIALINQGLGHDVGYLNPQLYQQIGPAGTLHTITEGDNGSSGVMGYKAGQGWTPVAGWGSPDGIKLLTWFRAHSDSASANVACQ